MSNKFRCIVVDDEQGAIDVLENYIDKVSWLEHVASFSDPLAALDYVLKHTVELVFMDINMPDLNGLQLSRMINTHETSVIFCTAYSEHALESYEIQALDYLLKPVPFERFLSAVNKLQGSNSGNKQEIDPPVSSSDEKLFIKSGSEIHGVDLNTIKYIEKDGHYVVLKTGGRDLLSRISFKELLKVLPDDKFVQVHRSYIVSVDKIQVIQKQFIQIDKKEIPIGDTFKKQFFASMNTVGN